MPIDLLADTHAETTRMDIHEVVRDLNRNLGTTLVAYLANVRTRQLPAKWAAHPDTPQHVAPRDEARKRLTLTHQVFHAIARSDNEYVARQWLLGANPFFDGVSPADEIREGNLPAVMRACKSFVADHAGG